MSSFLIDDDESFTSFHDNEENVTPNTKKTKVAASMNTSKNMIGGKNKVPSSSPAKKKSTKKKKTVEEMYQKKTQLEHILLRPDTYVGSVEPDSRDMFIIRQVGDDKSFIASKKITYTPGLFKIYDEILVNAADNAQRDLQMDKLDITIDADANCIAVQNNGKGIPVQMHSEHKMYIPTMIFGHLLTSSNYDDDERKTTGGRNGFGAKLANIFSTKFIVECLDTESGQHFRQVWENNMSKVNSPKIRKAKASEMKKGDFVRIEFMPDLVKFGMTKLDEDTIGLLQRRAVDVAGCLGGIRPAGSKKLSVSLNGTKIPIKGFKEYLTMYPNLQTSKDILLYEKSDRWEVAVSVSDGAFSNTSFVNGINTCKGGTHVNYIVDQITSHLCKALCKKKSAVKITPAQVKNHLHVSVNCLVVNPAFDSQTKETLTTKSRNFGSEFKLSDTGLKKLEKGDLAEAILSFAAIKQKNDLKKKSGVKKMKITVNKLDDANFAGGAKSKDCTLILTEGDSAKSLAMSGLSIVGRDYYGVFPLKGKPLNVRDASTKQVLANEELKNVVDIVGLKYQTEYNETNIKTLRYGHIMIMADQDHDGSHIKGLIINFIHFFWPSLLEIPEFLKCFITPIVKCTHKRKKKNILTFFNLPEYESWRSSTSVANYKIKYYKGLGTSTSAEAKEYFSNLDTHEVHFSKLSSDSKDQLDLSMFSHDDEEDVNLLSTMSGGELIEMAFSKKKVEERKTWLNAYRENTFLSYNVDSIRFSNFVNKELILFSRADNIRSIPNVFDGFKPSQRKVLFGCFKKNLKGEIKVAQLAGYIGEVSAYHHGEQSLTGTIVNMAQTFVGSNNINLLTPSGQFGTRRMGGKDCASARYIFTSLEKITPKIFHPDDDELLTYLEDDGLRIEPVYYIPVIPMLLVNGSEGIGTGWSTNVPNYSPRDIIKNLRLMINGEEPQDMDPWYHGYAGSIIKRSEGSYDCYGTVSELDEENLHITELPLKTWTQNYKEFLEKLEQTGDKKSDKDPDVKDFRENHTETTVNFTVTVGSASKMSEIKNGKGGIYGKFKLSGKINSSNMQAFNEEGAIHKYNAPIDIIKTFYDVRLDYYIRRKELLLKKLRRTERMLSNKARFVLAVCEGELVVNNRKKADLLAELKEEGYELFDGNEEERESSSDDSSTEQDSDLAAGYSYLLNMKLWSLTYEKVEELKSELAATQEKVSELEETSEKQIWLNDLAELEDALDERDEMMEAANREEAKARKKNAKQKKTKGKKKKKDWDSDASSSEEELESDDDFTTKKSKNKTKKQLPVNKPVKILGTLVPIPEVALVNKKAAKKKSKSLSEKMSVSKPTVITEKVSKSKKQMKVDKPIELVLSSDDDDEDAMEDIPLMQRIAAKKKKQGFGSARDSRGRKIPGTAASLTIDTTEELKSKATASKKRPSPRNNLLEEDDSEDDFFAEQKKSTIVSRKVAKTKAEKTAGSPLRKKKLISSQDTIEVDSDVEPTTAKTKSVPKKSASKGRKKTSPVVLLSDDDDSFVVDERTPPRRQASTRRGASKKVDYALMEEDSEKEYFSEEESEDEFDFDE